MELTLYQFSDLIIKFLAVIVLILIRNSIVANTRFLLEVRKGFNNLITKITNLEKSIDELKIAERSSATKMGQLDTVMDSLRTAIVNLTAKFK